MCGPPTFPRRLRTSIKKQAARFDRGLCFVRSALRGDNIVDRATIIAHSRIAYRAIPGTTPSRLFVPLRAWEPTQRARWSLTNVGMIDAIAGLLSAVVRVVRASR